MATYKKWLQAELDFIKTNQELFNDEQLGVKLSQMTGQNITTAMVRRQRRKLAIKKKRGRPSKTSSVTTNVSSTPAV